MERPRPDRTAGRAAERRTIAALSATGEAAAEEPAAPAPPGGGGVARNTAIFSIATGISRVAGLVREIVAASFFGTQRPGLGVHDRLPGPEPGQQPVRQRGAVGGVRAGVHRTAPEGPPQRGVPAGLDAVLDHADRRSARSRRSSSSRPGVIMPLFTGATFNAAARRADGRPLAGAVPGRAAARADGPARRDPAVLRPLHDPGDLAGGVERRDPRAAGRPAPALPRRLRRRQPALRVRDRDPRGDVRAAADGVRRARADRLPPAVARSTGTTRASGRCSR